jgi:hypothetical protein
MRLLFDMTPQQHILGVAILADPIQTAAAWLPDAASSTQGAGQA